MVAQEAVTLLLAARNGDLSSLQSDKVTESLQDEQGANCLHYAARGGFVPILKYLVNVRGFKPTQRSKVGATALHDAAATGNLEALQWLLEQADAKVDDQDGTGATVTHLSARYGHAQSVQWLLDETNCDVLKKSASGALPLHFAADAGHLECVKILIAEAPRSTNMQMNSGSTPVYLACQNGHLMTADYLAAKNGTPKIHTFDGMSPLHAAAQMGHLHIVKWLIEEQGMNPNERDFDGATPLHYAASRGHCGVVDWMLKEGGARIILDNLGGSPLHTAAEFGNNKIVSTLLDNGCSRDITDNQGLTAQELALKCGHLATAAILRGETVVEDESEPSPPTRRAPSASPQPPPPVFTPTPSTSKPQPVPSPQAKTGKRLAPPPSPKPSSSTQLPSLHSRASPSEAGPSGVVDSLGNLQLRDRSAGLAERSTSVVSVASSASSFGYFPPSGGGKTQVVNVDVHDSPSRACIFSSQETGEREVVRCPLTTKSSSTTTSGDVSKAAECAAFYLSATSATASQLPLKSSYLSPDQQSSPASLVSSDSQSPDSGNHNNSSSREARATERKVSWEAEKPQREESPSVAERKASLEAAAVRRNSSPRQFVSRISTMEEGKVNGTVANSDGSSESLPGARSSGGSAKSVIKISSNNVTIISTGKNGSAAPKVTTTPLRASQDQALSGAHVSARRKDTEFISALTQKFQPNGAPGNFVRPAPIASSANYRGSNSHTTSSENKNDAASTRPAGQQEQTAAAVASTAATSVAERRQQIADSIPHHFPPAVVNGHAEALPAVDTNGLNEDSSAAGATAPPPPPAPAPPTSSSLGEQSTVRKADASYTPRPKSSSSQSSVNGSAPNTPRGADYHKNDLMAALTAVVTSGSPSASLRKTRGPGKGGVNEVFSSKRASGATTPNGTEKQSSPLPPIEEFDPKNFLDQVEETDSAGNKIPEWKRQMKAKHLAQKAQEEYLEQKKIDDYEARFKNMPAWKRALIEKKESTGEK